MTLSPFPRDIGTLIGQMAENIAAQRESAQGISTGREGVARKTLIAPALNERASLSETGSMVPNTLEIRRVSDDFLYTPYTDFYEDSPPAGFINLAITPGTELIAEWYHEDPDPTDYISGEFKALALSGTWLQEGSVEPASRREGERVYLRGAIASGATAEDSALFEVDNEHNPDALVRISTMSDAGPVVIEISVAGVGTIGAGPSVAGNDWLLLDSLSYPSPISSLAPTFHAWPDVSRYPNTDRYPEEP